MPTDNPAYKSRLRHGDARTGAYVILLFLAAVFAVRLVPMLTLPMSDTTEPRYTETSRLMLEKNDWVTLWFTDNEPFLGKPPLAFWAQAVSMKVFSIADWSARLPSYLAVLALIAMTGFAGRLISGPGTGLDAAVIFATMALIFASAGAAMTDTFLTLGTTLALFGVVMCLGRGRRHWGWCFFLGLSIGLLAKGPITLVLVGLPVGMWVLWTGRWRDVICGLPWFRGSLLTLTLVAPWYILAEQRNPGFLHYFLIGEHIYRFTQPGWEGNAYGSSHAQPRGIIWLYLLFASLPWGIIALSTLVKTIATGKTSLRTIFSNLDSTHRLILLSAFAPPLFFSLASNTLIAYVLPGLPFLAILIATKLTGTHWLGRRRIWIAAVSPTLITLACLYYSAHPQKLPSQYALVRHFQSINEDIRGSLHYLDYIPHSARYYTRDSACLVSFDQLNTGKLTQIHYLAVRDRDLKKVYSRLNPLPSIIYTSGSYHLLRIAHNDLVSEPHAE